MSAAQACALSNSRIRPSPSPVDCLPLHAQASRESVDLARISGGSAGSSGSSGSGSSGAQGMPVLTREQLMLSDSQALAALLPQLCAVSLAGFAPTDTQVGRGCDEKPSPVQTSSWNHAALESALEVLPSACTPERPASP